MTTTSPSAAASRDDDGAAGSTPIGALTAAVPANPALEIAPIHVDLIAEPS